MAEGLTVPYLPFPLAVPWIPAPASASKPWCGFSNNVCQILNALAVPFETFDVLSDPEIRQGIKEFSDWPTIPQVYVQGEFMGGSDILIEMYNSGELL